MDGAWWLGCLAIGLLGGFLSGLLGIGGGVVMVPLLLWLFGESIHEAKAQSLAIIIIVSVAGTIKHYAVGRLQPADLWLVLACGVSAVIAGPFGVTVGEKLDKATLGRLFGLLLIFTGAKFLWPAKPPVPPVETASAAAEPGARSPAAQ